MSLCASCGERPANVFLKIQEGNQVRKLNLCEVCAQEQGFFSAGMDFGSWGKFGSALEQLVDIFGFPAEEVLAKSFRQTGRPAQAKCGHCSITYAAFKSSGFLGCSNCYEAFGPSLREIIRKIHGANIHTGVKYRAAYPPTVKAPAPPSPRQKIQAELSRLRKNLQEALKKEAYEEAVHLRDKIKEIESKFSSSI